MGAEAKVHRRPAASTARTTRFNSGGSTARVSVAWSAHDAGTVTASKVMAAASAGSSTPRSGGPSGRRMPKVSAGGSPKSSRQAVTRANVSGRTASTSDAVVRIDPLGAPFVR